MVTQNQFENRCKKTNALVHF